MTLSRDMCVYIIAFTFNCVSSKAFEKTPYEIWTGRKPSMSFLKI